VREAERRAHRPDRAIRLEQPAARHLGRPDRVELTAREAREAELGEDARPLAMGSGELARERRRPLGRGRLARRVAPAEALLGEPGVVGAGVALGYVREELARLRPAPEAREHARLPVFRGDACRPRAPPGEPRKGLGGGRHLAPEVADPRRAPACLRGERGVRVALGEARVGGPRIGPVSRLLRDASGGVERIRRRRAVREAPQHLAEEAQRPGVVVGVPPPAGGRGEGTRRERLRGLAGELEAGRLGGRAQPERALRLRAHPQDTGALQRLRSGERHLCLLPRPAGVAFLETHLGLVGVVERELGVRGAEALGEPPRAPGGEAARARAAQLARQLERRRRFARGALDLGQRERGARPAAARGRQDGARRGERRARARQVAPGALELAGHEPRRPDPDAVRMAADEPARALERLARVAGRACRARLEVEDVVLQRGMRPRHVGDQLRHFPGAAVRERGRQLRGRRRRPRVERRRRTPDGRHHPTDPPRRAPHEARLAYHAPAAPAT